MIVGNKQIMVYYQNVQTASWHNSVYCAWQPPLAANSYTHSLYMSWGTFDSRKAICIFFGQIINVPLSICSIELFWGFFVVIQEKYMEFAYRGWLLCVSPVLPSVGDIKAQSPYLSSSRSYEIFTFVFKELDGFVYIRNPFVRSVVATGVKLQMHHRNALREVMHRVCNVIAVFDCDCMF